MVPLFAIADKAAPATLLEPALAETVHQEALAICHPIMVDAGISQLLSNVISESLSLRQEEWRARDIDPSEANVTEILAWVRPSLVSLLSDATMRAQIQGRTYLLLIDIFTAITKNWCKIWPFCN